MKKTLLNFLLLALSLIFVVSALSSCDVVKDMFTVHSYLYAHDSEGHWGVCGDCGKKTEVEPHKFSLCETVAASCEHVGYEIFECSECKYSKTEFLPKTEHDFRSSGDSGARECANCHRRETELVELPDSERYGYTYLASLAEREKYLRAYEKISAAISVRSDKAAVFEILEKREIETIYHCVCVDHPEYFWLADGYSYTSAEDEIRDVNISYLMSEAELETAKEKFNAAADDILAGVSASMSDFEKELYVHDAIVRTNTYDETYEAPMTHSAYGALVLKTSVCDGYSELFDCLMARCGVVSVSLTGYSGDNHSWNVVKIDGEWYMVDPTWDDPVGNEPGKALHTYFNCSWEQMSFNHSFEKPDGTKLDNYFDVPDCVSDRYNYFTYFGYEGELTRETITRSVRLQAEKGEKNKFQIRFTDLTGTPDERKEAIQNYLSKDAALYSSIAHVLGKTALSIKLSYGISNDGNILNIFVD